MAPGTGSGQDALHRGLKRAGDCQSWCVAHGPAVLPYPPAVPLTLLSLCLILWHPSLAVYGKFKQNHIENLLSLLQALRLKLRTEPTLRNESLNFREQGEFFFKSLLVIGDKNCVNYFEAFFSRILSSLASCSGSKFGFTFKHTAVMNKDGETATKAYHRCQSGPFFFF